MSSQYSGCAGILLFPLAALGRWAAPAIDASIAQVRGAVGDRGCFVLLVSVALLALIFPLLLFDPGWGGLILLGGFLALIVIGVGSSYRLGSGRVSTGADEADGVGGGAMTGEELIARYRAGERVFRDSGLRGAMLRGTDLRGVDLSGANLAEASLSGADLRNANLSGANVRKAAVLGACLAGANLSRTNLRRAGLSGSDLTGANLSAADLCTANLTDANLTLADLTGADLTSANLQRAQFAMADLSCTHMEMATLDKADFTGADLTGSSVRPGQLSMAASLEGATSPDGTVHD